MNIKATAITSENVLNFLHVAFRDIALSFYQTHILTNIDGRSKEWALDEIGHRFIDRATTSHIYEKHFQCEVLDIQSPSRCHGIIGLGRVATICVQVTGVADAAQSDISHRYAFTRSYHTTVFG
jgi:hypothetical protein